MGIEANPIRINVAPSPSYIPSIEHPRPPHQTFLSIFNKLQMLQKGAIRHPDLERDMVEEASAQIGDAPIILNLQISVPNDPEDPNRVIPLDNFKFLGFQMDKSETWYALFRSNNDSRFSGDPSPFPISNLGVSFPLQESK